LASGQRSFVVEAGGQVAGLLTMHGVKEVPRDEWPTTSAAQITIPLAQVKRTRPDTELWSAMEEMNRDGVNQLLVMEDGRILGVPRREDISTYLRNLRDYVPRVVVSCCIMPYRI
jgi:CBS domain-containing protein